MREVDMNEFCMGININQRLEYYYAFQNKKESKG